MGPKSILCVNMRYIFRIFDPLRTMYTCRKFQLHGIRGRDLAADPLKGPPIAIKGNGYVLWHIIFQASQGIMLYTPNSPYRNERGVRGRGYPGSSSPLEGIALYGGTAAVLSPIAV